MVKTLQFTNLPYPKSMAVIDNHNKRLVNKTKLHSMLDTIMNKCLEDEIRIIARSNRFTWEGDLISSTAML